MKKLLLPGLVLAMTLTASAQNMPPPVKWNYTVERTSPGEATLVLTAVMDEGWHIYSQFTPDGGPLPTVFTFDDGSCYKVDGKATEPKAHEEFDPVFDVKVLTLDGKPEFRQKIQLKGDGCTITGNIVGQVCKDVCLMFEDTFTFHIDKDKAEGMSTKKQN